MAFLPSTPNPGNKFIGVKFTFTNNGMAASDPFTDMFFTLMDESLTVTYREEWALDRDDTVVAMDEVGVGCRALAGCSLRFRETFLVEF